VEAIAQAQAPNPLIIVDELDKGGSSNLNGRIVEALLPFLEPQSAGKYYDECLMATADLSHVCWAAAANEVRTLPPPLLSRFRVVKAGTPKPEHGPNIAAAVAERLCRRFHFSPSADVLDQESQNYLMRFYTSAPSPREITTEVRRQFSATLRRRMGTMHLAHTQRLH
jgi:ATP-dependent Lon protease